MTKREKQATMLVALSLLAFGTAFAFFGKKEEDEDDGGDETCPPGTVRGEDGTCVPIEIIPADLLCPPGQHRETVRHGTAFVEECVNDTDDTPGDIDDIIKTVPVGGNFYQVVYGDWPGYGSSFSSKQGPGKGLPVATWLLRREMFEAAREFGGLTEEGAWAFVNTHIGGTKAYNPGNRTLDLILCSAYNDACFGTYGYCGQKAIDAKVCPAAQRNHAGPTQRSIRFLKQHPNNINRIRQKMDIARYVSMGTPANAGDGSSKNKSGKNPYYPALWMPKMDRQLLWESTQASNGFPGNIAIEPTPETWDDGSPMSSPPPWIMRDGRILDFSGSLNLPGAYGCADQKITFVPGG